MLIDKVNIYQVVLPFSIEFSHSLRKRFSAKNIIVEVIADHGEIKGYGEGAPRSYVTGESQESAAKMIKHFIHHDNFPWELSDVSQVWDFVDYLSNVKEHNSAICSIEMSLLDALGKRQGKYIIEYFPHDFFINTIYYGAAIPIANKYRVIEISQLIKRLKINKLKLKVDKNFSSNKEAIETISSVFEGDYDLKIDVNGAWDYELALKHASLIKENKVQIVEQPMMPGDEDISEFAELMRTSGVVLMADESACSLRDVEGIYKDGLYGMINIRLSKCGGLRNSLKIINYLRTKKLSFQIGCQLGESGLLSAAGRILSLLCCDAAYYDGSYDQYLLKENVTFEDVSFGLRGEAGPLNGFGLGVEINRENLMRLSDGFPCATISNHVYK